MKSNVTAIISTRDRYFTTLPQVLISIAQQTVRPDALIIYDDGECRDLRNDSLYENIFKLLDNKGLEGNWKVLFGEKKGQVLNHQKSIKDVQTEWIWRLDDDNIAEPDTLEKLLKNVTPEVGAVAGLVVDPKMGLKISELASNKIEDIFLGMNIQWFNFEGVKEVDHLYSSFIYRKEAAKHGYCMELSKVGHREETIFTYEMKRNGWKLLVDPTAVTWHMRASAGGIRSEKDAGLWQHDEEIFKRKLGEWKVVPRDIKLVVLDCGLGDTLVFKKTLPDLRKKYKNIVVAMCYREVFANDVDIKLISIAEAQMLTNILDFNIYKAMIDWDWKDSLESAFRRLYQI